MNSVTSQRTLGLHRELCDFTENSGTAQRTLGLQSAMTVQLTATKHKARIPGSAQPVYDQFTLHQVPFCQVPISQVFQVLSTSVKLCSVDISSFAARGISRFTQITKDRWKPDYCCQLLVA